MFSLSQEPGLLAPNEHATAFAVESVRAGHIDLIATVHRLTIGIIANKPAERRQALRSRLQINRSLHDPAEIIGILNDLMELKRILVGVAPNGPSISMACILSEIIQANPIPAQQRQAGTSPAMARNYSLGVLDIHPCPCTQHRNQRRVDETPTHAHIPTAEEILHLLAVLLIKQLALRWRSFLLPDLERLRDVVR